MSALVLENLSDEGGVVASEFVCKPALRCRIHAGVRVLRSASDLPLALKLHLGVGELPAVELHLADISLDHILLLDVVHLGVTECLERLLVAGLGA